jgi:two-component system, LytTR family, sensor kinase
VPLAVHVPASLGIAVVKLVTEAMIVRAIIGPGRVPFSLLKIHLTVLTYWAIVAAVQYAEQHRLSRERELRAARLQTELARAQMESLKMQIHPHFLFNTLNAIAGLMREDVELADTMLAQLSELLRGTLQTEGVQEVPLSMELRLLRAYLSIQQTRFGDRLRIEIDVPDGCEQSLVPTLILQPLVENAIRHGFSATPGPGCIAIRVSAEPGRLRIDVTDEGRARRSRFAKAMASGTRGRACRRSMATMRRFRSSPRTRAAPARASTSRCARFRRERARPDRGR